MIRVVVTIPQTHTSTKAAFRITETGILGHFRVVTDHFDLTVTCAVVRIWIIFIHDKAVLELEMPLSLMLNPHKTTVIRVD